jgi:hypothetical protein
MDERARVRPEREEALVEDDLGHLLRRDRRAQSGGHCQ